MGRRLKYFASFFKRTWRFEDYPIADMPIAIAEELNTADQPENAVWMPSWLAMTGFGESRQAALDDLRRKFDEFVASGEPLPRPGTLVFTMAETARVERHYELAAEFLDKVLGQNIEQCLITDDSALSQFLMFEDPETSAATLKRIRELYNVDVDQLELDLLVDIFDEIAKQRDSQNT